MMRYILTIVIALFALPQFAFGGEVIWSKAPDGLMIGVMVSEPFVTLTLRNVGAEQFSINSHVISAHGDEHLDWFEVQLVDADDQTRVMRFLDSREGNVPIVVHLDAGAQFSHTVNVVEWSKKMMNGGVPVQPGVYTLKAVYEVGAPLVGSSPVWAGRVETPPAPFGVADQQGVVPLAPEKSPYIYEGDLLAE